MISKEGMEKIQFGKHTADKTYLYYHLYSLRNRYALIQPLSSQHKYDL